MRANEGNGEQTRYQEEKAQHQALGQALQMHAQDHQQYVPIQGYLGGGNPGPAYLADPHMKKYDYYFDPAWGMTALPLPGALAQYLGATCRTDSYVDMEADVHTTGYTVLRTAFQCPADLLNGTDPAGEVIPEGIAAGQVNLAETSSYLTNAGVFGLGAQYGFARAAGSLALLSDASEQIMVIDGLPPQPPFPFGDMEFFDPIPMGRSGMLT